LLDRATEIPELGARPFSMTVPVDTLPPITLDGIRVTEERVSGAPGVTVKGALTLTPL
jgi:hypothetical protein